MPRRHPHPNCSLARLALSGAFLVMLAAPAAARWKYPPGPSFRSCPDTLSIFDVQESDTLLARCHPAALDTVSGLRGIVTAFDTKGTSFSFYIQNTFANGPHPWTGVNVFSGSTNYNSLVQGTPTGGNLALGDSVVVYGTIREFQGETGIEGPDASTGTNDLIIRRIGAGRPLPAAKTGSTATFNRNPAVSAASAEPWEGCLVRISGPLRVARIQTGAGITANTFLVVSPSAPSDSVLVDGLTLTTFVAPPVGSSVDYVQGILGQSTAAGANSYRIQLRDANDISVVAPPNLIDAYPIEDNRLRLVFDTGLDPSTARNRANYSLASASPVIAVTLAGGAGDEVELDIGGTLADGAAEAVTASGIGSSRCPVFCLSSPQSRSFVRGVLSVATIQAPDPAHLGHPCEDRSRFAGSGPAPGSRLTVRGIAVERDGDLYYLADATGGPRTGVAVSSLGTQLITGHRYRIAGAVQEVPGATEVSGAVDVLDEGLATAPGASLATVAALRDTSCDNTQSRSTADDFEGALVRVSKVRVVPFDTEPTDPVAGGPFRVVQPAGPGAPDTLLVSNPGAHYSFDATPGMVLDVSGVFRHTSGSPEILPRGDSDITFLLGIQPSSGGDQGPVSVVITGVGLQNGTTAKLVRPGQPDIVGVSTLVAPDGLSLTTTLDLQGKATGLWDAIITYPDAHTDTLPGAFTITAVVAPQLRVDVIGPGLIRAGRRTGFDIVIDNSGNIDALDVPLWVTGIPSDAKIEPDFTLAYPSREGGEPDWTKVPLGFTSLSGSYFAIVIPRVPPGTSVRRVYLTIPVTDPALELRAAVTPPWIDGAVFRACLAGSGLAAPACMGEQLTAINGFLAASPAITALSGVAMWAKIAWQCEGAATLPAALAKAGQVLDYMVRPVEQPAAVLAPCGDVLPPRWVDALPVTIVGAVDPNEKIGARDTLGAQDAIPYSIRFENSSSASAPAQNVAVVDPLDPVTLSDNTVNLGAIIFGDTHLYPPLGLSRYSTTVNVSATLAVRIVAAIESGVLSWYFTSIDRATGQPPADPLAGFLPPNRLPPEGEGSVLFTVRPKPSLVTGTQIRNGASIQFDANAPLSTPLWVNTFDNTPPASHVLPLGGRSDQPTIPVQWTADGAPTDLRDFTIYVREDGAAYRIWRLNTHATADTLAPPRDHHVHNYAFYSVARDMNGNVEAAPAVPDAATQSTTPVEGTSALSLALEGARPNPAVGSMRVWFTLPSREDAALDLIDIAGRRVLGREVGALGPGRHSVTLATTPQLRPGLYFLRLTQGGRELHARVAVLR